jgi:hypothetical protein
LGYKGVGNDNIAVLRDGMIVHSEARGRKPWFRAHKDPVSLMETGVLLFLASWEIRITKDMAFKVITSQRSLPN